MMVSQPIESGQGCSPETTLFAQAQAGCTESLNLLMARHERLVYWWVNRQQLCGLAYDEAVQAGRYGLWRAILGYDPQRGVRFATYASKAIMDHIWAAVETHLRHVRRQIPWPILLVYFEGTSPDPAELCDSVELGRCLHRLVVRLPERLTRVIQAYYGLNGQEPHTLQAIGDQLGLTRERVRQLRNEALVWLRQPAHSQELRSLCTRHNQAQYELADQLAQAWLLRRGGRSGRCKTLP